MNIYFPILQALKLLAVLAAVRLEDKTDKIERILRSSLLDVGSSSMNRHIEGSTDPLALSTWDEASMMFLMQPFSSKFNIDLVEIEMLNLWEMFFNRFLRKMC